MADYSDNTPRTIADDIKDQKQVVRMLEARDEMNAAVHTTTVRLSPVTQAAKRVLKALIVISNGDVEISPRLIWDIDGMHPHDFIALADEDGTVGSDPICAIVGCAADENDGGYRTHLIHQP